MFIHSAFGLTFESDVRLLLVPQCSLAPGQSADVTVRRAAVPRVGPPPSHGSIICWGNAEGDAGFMVPRMGEFRVSGGREIAYDLDPEVDGAPVAAYVIGVAMALMLHQRGFLVMHGSAIEYKGRAFAFVAPKFHGKSTISAALQARGCKLVTDDLIPVKVGKADLPMVMPGYPFSKVWPDAFAALGEDHEKSPKFIEGFEKRLRAVSPDGLAAGPCPLGRMYVLGWGEEIEVEPIVRAEAFQQAVTHTHHHVMPLVQATAAGQVAHFKALGNLLLHASISRLRRPRNLDSLDATCDVLLRDFESF